MYNLWISTAFEESKLEKFIDIRDIQLLLLVKNILLILNEDISNDFYDAHPSNIVAW